MLILHGPVMLAETDIGQVIFIVVAMVAAFLQWVWKLVQENKASKERARMQETDQGPEPLRSEAGPPSLPEPAGYSEPPDEPVKDGIWSLVEEFKKEMQKAQEVVSPAPPPLPEPVAPPPRKREFSPPLQPAIVALTQVPTTESIPPRVQRSSPAATSHKDYAGVRATLMNIGTLKQAIILREILGPPKALQSPEDMVYGQS